jgi:hypothetical protein
MITKTLDSLAGFAWRLFDDLSDRSIIVELAHASIFIDVDPKPGRARLRRRSRIAFKMCGKSEVANCDLSHLASHRLCSI